MPWTCVCGHVQPEVPFLWMCLPSSKPLACKTLPCPALQVQRYHQGRRSPAARHRPSRPAGGQLQPGRGGAGQHHALPRPAAVSAALPPPQSAGTPLARRCAALSVRGRRHTCRHWQRTHLCAASSPAPPPMPCRRNALLALQCAPQPCPPGVRAVGRGAALHVQNGPPSAQVLLK